MQSQAKATGIRYTFNIYWAEFEHTERKKKNKLTGFLSVFQWMIHSGWITNSRWLCKHMCLDSLGNLHWVGVQRVIWVIGTTLRIGARQSGAISNSVLATQMRSPCLLPLSDCGKTRMSVIPSDFFRSAFSAAEFIAGTWWGLAGLTCVVNIFSGVGWLAMVRNNFMIAFFSEIKTSK